jgi:hypothetical protein
VVVGRVVDGDEKEDGAVVSSQWPSDALWMDGREGVRYFPRVGRPFPSITESNIGDGLCNPVDNCQNTLLAAGV